jgi:hypothetical protein
MHVSDAVPLLKVTKLFLDSSYAYKGVLPRGVKYAIAPTRFLIFLEKNKVPLIQMRKP